MKMNIMDKFDISSYSRHNSLVQALIEVIQDAMEQKEKDIQLLCFKFFGIQTVSRSKLGYKVVTSMMKHRPSE